MSKQVDERVVSMQFDNKQFEKNVSTSMSSIDKLNKSLKLTEASKGLENVSAASKKVDMSGLSGAVQTVQAKFSALEVMAVTALANITNSAVNAGKRMVSALTIDPIKTGLSEYETQINAVQTILANTESKGTTLKDVNSALDELNTYADKTIYNFTEMTKNIGTFTAAGVDLDTSVRSIQGIANLAAVSGSTSQQASTAMYQLSQALAAGKVSLMDWNSVVNAGMGGQVFQDALKRTAETMGTDVDALIKQYGSFRESLTQGEWLTADVLTKTLEQFTMSAEEGTEQWEKYKKSLMDDGYTEKQAEEILKMANTATDAATKVKTFTQLWDTLKETAQSGWTQTWEILLGDFEEAKSLFSNIYETLAPMIDSMSKARNDLLQGWKDAGGRSDLLESFSNAFKGLMSIIKPIKEAFREIFPRTTVDQLVNFTTRLKELTSKMILSEETADKVKSVFKGVFSVLSIGIQIISGIVKGFFRLLSYLGPVVKGLLGFASGVGKGITKVNEFAKSSNIFTKIFTGIGNAIGKVIEVIARFASSVKNELCGSADTVNDRFSPLTAVLEFFKKIFTGLGNVIKKVAPGVLNILHKIGDVFSAIFSGIGNAIVNADFNAIFDLINTGIFGGLVISFRNFLKSFSGIGENISGLFEGLTTSLTGLVDSFTAKNYAGVLLKIAISVGILAIALIALANVDSERLNAALVAIAGLFAGLLASMSAFEKIMGSSKNIKTTRKATKLMIGMSVAILILASAVKKLAELDNAGLARGLIGVAALTAILMAFLAFMKKMESNIKTMTKGAKGLIIFAAALLLLAKVVKNLGAMETGALVKGLIGVAALTAILMAFLAFMKKIGSNIKTMMKGSTGLVIFASALLLLAKVVKNLGAMETGALVKGLIGIAALTAVLIVFLAFMKKIGSNIKTMMKGSTGLVIFASALLLLSAVVKNLGNMNTSSLVKGLIGIAALTVVLIAFLAFMKLISSNIKSLMKGSTGLVIMAAALLILSKVVKNLGSLDVNTLKNGIIAVAALSAVLAGLALISRVVKPVSMLVMSAALIVLTAAIGGLAIVMKVLGSMRLADIGKALLALAGVFVVLGIGAKLLQPVSGALLKVAVAALVFGVAVAAIGAGVLAFSIGLSSLVASIASVVGLIPRIFAEIGKGIVAFFTVISSGVPAIGEAIKAIVLTIVDVLVECVPRIVEGILIIVSNVLASLAENIPSIVDSLFKIIIGIIDGIAKNLPTLVKSVVNLFKQLFSSVIDELKNVDPSAIKETILTIGVIVVLMKALSAVKSAIPGAMVGILGVGVIIAEIALILAALGALAQIPGLTWLINEGGKILQGIGNAVGSFIGGLIGGIAKGMSSALPEIGTNLSEFMTNVLPFIEGAKSFDASALDGVKALAEVILILTAANILDGISSWLTGGSSLSKFGEELIPFGKGLKGFADEVAGIDPKAIMAAAIAGKALAAMTSCIPNSGGVVSWFAGDNSISAFGADIIELGKGLKGFSDEVAGITPENIISAAEAGKALAEMTSCIPNSGGVVSWFAGDNSISAFGADIIELGKGLKGFADEVTGITPETVTAASDAAKALAEMTSCIPNSGGVVSWFAGDNSISAFGEDIIKLGKGLKGFSDEVAGITPETVIAASNAAKALAEMTACIPNSGGVVSWFAGDNSIANFGEDIIKLGVGLKGFSDEVSGVTPDSVVAAANAAKALAEMTACIPNSGGVVSWFAGDNSLSAFSEDIIKLGVGLKGFSDEVSGITPDSVVAAANAAKALAEMSACIPNSGGVVSWFAGDNSIAKFGGELGTLGKGLSNFSKNTEKVKPDTMTAAANAAKVLAEMTACIPNEGGVAAWFAGENSISKFGGELGTLGKGLSNFSKNTEKVKPDTMTAAANAAKVLAEMTACIPNEGGVAAWFAGENSISKFGDDLGNLGIGIKNFSTETEGITPETVSAAANACKTLAEMTSYLPNEGGVAAWFSGEKSISKFSDDMKTLGTGIKGFADEVNGITPEAVTAAANACKTLAEMTACLPNEGGVIAWFAGDKSIANFGDGLTKLGTGIKGFATETEGITPETVTAATNACKTLAEMTACIPDSGGVVSWFTGDNSISKFGDELKDLGTGIKGFSDEVSGIVPANVTAAANAGKTLAQMTYVTGESDLSNLGSFGEKIVTFGEKLSSYYNNIKDIKPSVITTSSSAIASITASTNTLNPQKIGMAATAISDFVKSLRLTSGITEESVVGFNAAIGKLGKANVDSLLAAYEQGADSITKAGETMLSNFITGLDNKKDTVTTKIETIAKSCVSKLKEYFEKFKSAGKYLVKGFANGISENTYIATAKAKAMAKAAEDAAKKELDINSPSKVFGSIGMSVPEGFAMGIDKLSGMVKKSSISMADGAIDNVKNSISRIAELVNSDIDTQPTIRPVLDLSDVRTGAGALNNMLDIGSTVGVRARIGSISSMMNNRVQNGSNSDVISAIEDLGKKLGNMSGDTYTVNGVTYDDGSNINSAVKTIVRAAKIARRV